MRSLVTLGLFAATLPLLIPASSSAQMDRPFDSTYLATDTYLAIFAKPAKLMEHMEKNPWSDEFFEEMKREIGLSITDIDQVVFQFGGGDSGTVESDHFALIVRGKNDLPMESIVAGEWGGSEQVDFNGRPMFKPTNEYSPGLYFPSDSTMIVAETPRLVSIAETPMTMSSLVSKLRDVDASVEFAILMDGDMVTDDLLNSFFGEIPQFGPKTIAELACSVKEFRMLGTIMSDVPIEATIVADDVESAKQIQTTLQAGLELGRLQLPMLKKQSLNEGSGLSEEEMTMVATSFEGFEAFLKGAEISVEGNEVQLTVTSKGGLPQLMMGFNAFFMMTAIQTRRVEEALIEDAIEVERDAAEAIKRVDRDR